MKISLLCSVILAGLGAAAASEGVESRDAASSIWQDIEHAASCGACETLLVALQALAHTGNNNFVKVITDVCIDSKKEDPDVCTGAIALEGPILAHNLRQMKIGSKTAQLFCGTVFGLCSYPAVDDYSISFPSARPANATRPGPSGQPPISVVHMSDIHVDLSYETGANANCTKNICCRPYTAADAPGNNSDPAGPYGNTKCDSPLALEETLYSAIQELVPDSAFTIFTGDVVEGAVWLVNEDEVTNDLNDAFSRMQANLNLVYPVVGNHDAAPVNSFPPAAIDTDISSQWVYNTLSSDWISWIGSASQSVTNYGAYSVQHPNSTLRVISFNSNLYYKENFWLYEKDMETDPSGQLAWLVSELSAAESAGERVWLMGHMPMGAGDALHDGSNYFNQIIDRYSATIAALFFGHTHKDEFEISYSDYSAQTAANAMAMSYIAPALTPTSGNPTFRVYSVDPVTYGILDYTVYFANISSPDYQNGPTWEKYYSAKETYGSLISEEFAADAAAELTPAFWHNITAAFEADDDAFQAYIARKSRGYFPGTCTGSCKTDEICQLRAGEAQYNCITVTPGIDFKKSKRDMGGSRDEHHHADGECGHGVISGVLKSADTEQLRRRIAVEMAKGTKQRSRRS